MNIYFELKISLSKKKKQGLDWTALHSVTRNGMDDGADCQR